MDYQAIFLDIDGTILRSDHSLSDRVAAVLRRCREAGVALVPATGRSWESLEPVYRMIGLDGPAICYNGAMLVGGPDGRVLAEHRLGDAVSRAAVAAARRRNLHLLAFRHTRLLIERNRPEAEEYRRRTKLDAVVGSFDDVDPLDFTKMIAIADPADLVPLKAEMEGLFGPDRLSITFSDPRFLEMMAGGCDKGGALREMCRLEGWDPARTLAAGDGWNDWPLLEAAGAAVVMGGAPDEMKARVPASRVAPHADEDGLAVYLEGLLGGSA